MRLRILLSSLLATVAVIGFAATPAGALEVGVNETLGQTLPTADTAAQLGAGWVRLWSSWDKAQPAAGDYDEHFLHSMNAGVDAAKAKGLKVLMVVQHTPAWASGGRGVTAPPSDPATLGRFMRTVAQSVPGVDAWEIWNEPDGAEFFMGGAQPAVYAAMLKAAYTGVKSVQPRDLVVTGGTVANDFDFIEALYAHGAKGYFDAVGVHTDTACLTVGPDFVYRDERGHLGRYIFSSYREVHDVMARHGDGAKRIWMTETGWNTASTAPRSCNAGDRAGTKPLGVTEAQQAQFLTAAYRCTAADPFVGVVFWFGMQDVPGGGHATGYGLYRGDGSAKPAAAAFKALRAGIAPDRGCGGVVDHTAPRVALNAPSSGSAFVDMVRIDAAAVDEPGGAGVRRIELFLDGKKYRSFGDGHAKMPRLWPSRTWKRGWHTITFKASDEAMNESSLTIRVKKVKRLSKVKTRSTLALVSVAGRTTQVTGRLTSAGSQPAAAPGRVFVTYQKWVKQGRKHRWRTLHRIGRKASTQVDVTKAVKAPGRWRVFLAYPGRGSFRKSSSAPVAFRVS